jgi:predicted transcriptional regulator
MPSGWRGTSAGEAPIQHLEFRDKVLIGPTPVRKFLAAGATNLEAEELDHAIMNAVIVRFENPLAILVAEPE